MTNNGDDIRPSPEAMLKLAQAEEVAAELGKLKIFRLFSRGGQDLCYAGGRPST